MTTANLVVNAPLTRKSELLWTWHDGYQFDGILNEAIKKTKFQRFTLSGLNNLITKHCDFEKAYSNDGRGDWSWSLTILDEKHAVLTGAGCGEVKTKWLDLSEVE